MSKRGENIYKRKDGRWEGRITVCFPSSKKVSVYGKTYREVKEKLMNYQTTTLQFCNQMDTVASAILIWLSEKEKKLKTSTCVKYKNLSNKYILPRIGDVPVRKLTKEIVTNFFQSLSDVGVSSKVVKDVFMILKSAILHLCGTVDLILPDLSAFPKKSKLQKITVLSNHEQTRLETVLLDRLDEKRFGILLCLYTGLRIGELCALRWENINLCTKSILITKTMQRLQSQNGIDKEKRTVIIETDPKSLDSMRVVPIADFLVYFMESMRPMTESAYLLTGTEKYIEPRSYTNLFKRVLKEAGIRDYNFHALRHTFATRCIENGMDVKSVSEILGHSTTKITLDRYVHPSLERKQDWLNKLADSRQISASVV